jgi:hypothetical protein
VSRSGRAAWRGFRQFFIAASRLDQGALVECRRSSTRGAAMSRFTMALIAAATAAVAAIAVVALPAIGDDKSGSGNDIGAFVTCLRAHGLDGAPSDPMALKPWLGQRETSDPAATKAALDACNAEQPARPAVTDKGPGIDEAIDCVRKHGFDAPTDPIAFKQWLGRQASADDARLHAALDDCKLARDPEAKPGAGKCGGPSDQPPADKPQGGKPPAKSAPPAPDGSV